MQGIEPELCTQHDLIYKHSRQLAESQAHVELIMTASRLIIDLSSVVGDNNLMTIVFKVMYLWYTKHIDNGYRERLHERLRDVSIVIQQSL